MSEYVEKMLKDYYLYCVIDFGLLEFGEIVIEIDLVFVIYIYECWFGGDSKCNFMMCRLLIVFEFLMFDNIFLFFCKNLE